MPGRVAHGTYSHDLGRRHPFEVAMLSAAVFVGASRILAPASGSLSRTLPDAVIIAWYVMITLGSVLALIGVFWREATEGLLIERAGLFSVGTSCFIYGFAVAVAAGWRGIPASAFVFGFAIACAVRVWDIGRVIVRIRALALAAEVVMNEAVPPEEGESKE